MIVGFNEDVYIMDENGHIYRATNGLLTHRGIHFHFIEKDGEYAYSEFFKEGIWPDIYYDDPDLIDLYYRHEKLKMVSGGWCKSISDLIQSISYRLHDSLHEIDEKNDQDITAFLTRFHNGEDIVFNDGHKNDNGNDTEWIRYSLQQEYERRCRKRDINRERQRLLSYYN
jgi:hypothetical protein